jgi:hypothetical protein
MELALRVSVEAQQAKAELRDVEKGLDGATKSAENFGKSMDDLKREIIPNLDEIRKRVNKLDDDLDNLNRKPKKTSDGMGALNSTLMKYASGAVMLAAIKATADYADKLEDLAGNTNMTVTAMSKFDGSARKNGASIDLIATAVETLQDRIGGGDKSLLRGLGRLGISLDDLRQKSSQDQFLTLARALSDVQSQTERMTIANDLFGGSAKKLLPTLVDIGENYETLAGLSEDVVSKTAKLSNAWDTLKTSGTNLLMNVLSPIAPALNGIADAFSWAASKASGFLASATGPLGMYQDMVGQFADPSKMPAINDTGKVKARQALWQDFLNKGRAANLPFSGESPVVGLRANDAETGGNLFGGYTGAIESQINDQLREQAKLHKEREAAAEKASKAAAKAAAMELEHWRDLIDANRKLMAPQTAALGADFDLFMGRSMTARGDLLQGYNYFDPQMAQGRSLAGVMGPITGPQSRGNIGYQVTGRPGVGVNTMLDYAGYYGGGNVGGQLADIYRGSRQTQAQLGRYGVGSQMFTGSTGNRLAAGAAAGVGVAEGAMEVWSATDKAGAGERALGGMMAGAKAGAMFGPYGMAIGAAAGLVVGLVRGKPEWAKAADEVGRDFGVKISDALGKEIAKSAKELFKGDRSTGAQYHLSQIIQEDGGITDKNFDKMAGKLRDTYSFLERGQMNEEQASKVIEENFGAFADHVTKSKDLASKSFQELFELNKRFGLESSQMRQFVEGQTGTLGQSVAALAAPLVEKVAGLDEERQGVLGGMQEAGERGDTAAYEEAKLRLNDIEARHKELAAASAEEIERLGVIAVGSFNAAIQGGMGYVEAVEAMGPALDSLIGLQKDLGITSENTALAELTSFRDRVNANQTLVMSTQALGETMRALASIGGLNTETLAAMEGQGLETFKRLTEAGFTENQSLTMMKDFLLNVIQAHEQLGTPIDANTQKLIDQANAAGLLKDKGNEFVDVFKEGFGALLEVLGGDLPESWRDVEQASVDTEQQVKADAAKMAGSQEGVGTSVEELEQRVRDSQQAWGEWRDFAVDAAGDVYDAVNAVTFGHSPGGIKEIPIKLKEAIAAAHLFKQQAVADFEATEAAVNALSDEQEDAIRLLMEAGRPLDDIAFALDMSTQALDLFIDREREAATAAEDAARAVESQRLETERMAESLAAMQSRAQDEVSVLKATGISKDLLQLDQRQRDEVAAAEALRPTLGHAVDQTIALINQKFDVLRNDVSRRYNDEFNRDQANEQARLQQNEERYNETAQRLQDQIALIGKSGLERDLLQLGFGRRDEMADVQRMAEMFSTAQMQTLLGVIAEKYARLEAEARADEAARVGGAMLGGYVGAHGVQYLRTGGKVLGFAPRGSDTVPTMLTPGEGVLSRRGMQALSALNRGEGFGGGDVFHITVNGADDPEAVANTILRKVAQKRKLSRGRRAA